ncbi:DNA polymerase epsilon catalytic subunit A-like [Glycine soja]|uniref:DNA polymerase epsilon catalytic subunit n=1 Tax=Glycine soja TaxID=3848 RepID=A0A445HN36_GLYSO|nr:DNA polymerase epsilon catalytic subunit A-like [Glycine soja]RZB74984.1 DNA polymerase epsilon catalytic subunit A [Glycine soja]
MSGDGRRRDRRDNRASKKRKLNRTPEEELEAKLGFDLFSEGEKRLGWLLTFASSSVDDEDSYKVYSCVDLYFVAQDGSSFKTKFRFRPYFYVATKDKMEIDVEAYLKRRYEGQIADVEIIEKEDLDLKNHLSGLRKSYLKLSFDTVQQLMDVKRDLMPTVERNKAKSDAAEAFLSVSTERREHRPQDFLDCITDVREYDVPYHVRFAIDNDIRCGQWYDVGVSSNNGVTLEKKTDLLQRAEVRICAFDIETTKLPLKFPDADYDLIMMISYMVDGQGYLIINRECVGDDIEDIEYTPKPEFEGCFKVTNAQNEIELLRLWFSHMQEVKPGIYVTYNGDFFDWPFLERRATHHGFKMSDELGFKCDMNQGECRARYACHLDCFAWVKRDSYLPQGSQGLKAVTKAKLGYDPLEVNPEDMVRFAKEKPQMMASYSVSDAVATYYLYTTYVHPFIFSLATIIPMSPDEVLRKGSGTLCEMLLMVQAYKANVICPNKHQSDPEKFYNNHLLESETYIGGHVECLESGVFRSDIPSSFTLEPSAYQQLINNLDRDLQYAITVEGKMDLEFVSNYDEVKNAIMEKLVKLRDAPIREECPLIYHLDVAAMYPNIILTNRLQPPSIVTEEVCTACDFNRPGKTCLRKLEWVWRGETFMAKKSDYYALKTQIESEFVDDSEKNNKALTHYSEKSSKSFLDLPKAEQQSRLKERLKKYCQKAYKRVLDKPVTELREAGICMRENPFYVDTVRSFRDRRYEYKGLNKVWKGKLSEAKASGNSMKIQEAQDMVVLYDSLQLAHKCILNSFYGYVMRKGARWYSMEMAGVVTYTGAKIIQNARLLVEKIGKPLELDTDGIWCALPGSFPENFTFKTKDPKKKFTISYPCVMLNVDVAINNTNDQYQTLTDPIRKTYTTHSECSIEFEVDGPYKAMILPASKEEGILIKKRYAVFNDDGTLAELKGFEIKRRGELKLIKVFQAELFDKFLHGSTLEECYSAVASVANGWLDLLDNQGKDIADSELLDYISESSTMSKSLADYGQQKSCAVTTARRLADFLGDTMVKDKGLRCQYIVASEPKGTPVSERAVPVAIFETDAEVMKFYVRKWCKVSSDVGIRSIVDWSYYKQRLSSAIQKIITIPAAMQKVANPVPRVVHPDWLHKKVREKEDKFRQRKLVDAFKSMNRNEHSKRHDDSTRVPLVMDGDIVNELEDFGNKDRSSTCRPRPIIRHYEANNEQHSRKVYDQEDVEQQHNKPLQQNVYRSVDYQGWLQIKKQTWKDILERRKKQRLENSKKSDRVSSVLEQMNGKGNQGRSHVSSYLKRLEVDLTKRHWQIIQLVPSSLIGQFFAWVVVDGSMHKIHVSVPRVFYLNSRSAITEGFMGKRVNKTLPHGRHSYNLYEVSINEIQYGEASQKLAALLADPDVEGVYETKVPLEFNAIVQLGCVCKVDKTANKRSLQEPWNLSELHMKTTAECAYLEQSISFFYFYHSISEGRAIYIGYFPASKTMTVVVVNPYQNKDLSPVFLERHFHDACQSLSIEPPPRNGINFKVDYVAHVKDAEAVMQRAINGHSHGRENHMPMVAVIECPNVQLVKLGIRALDNFPCLSVPYNARDSQYQILGWQQVAAKTGMQRCAASVQWLNQRIALSRYAHVPLGNFELDWLIFIADIFFSRALHDNQQVLWISDDGLPDLGGINSEQNCFVDEVQQPALTYPGAYRNVTVELKIHHLAVNALLKYNLVNEMEGGTLLRFGHELDSGAFSTNDQNGFDESTSCVQAFRVLKQLIQRCLADAVTSGNVYADSILQHLYRWLCSPKSKLHDPALHQLLHKVMQKVFALLLAEFRKLGATIVFANFSKIIIDTGKYDLSRAKAYCDSLLRTIQSRDLFEWIELEPLQFWCSLLFMDQYNYGGIPTKSDEAVNNESQVDIISSWNIAEYLPKKIQDHFVFIVSQFMYIPWNYAKKQAQIRASLQNGDSCTPSINIGAAEAFESEITEFTKEQIGSYFTHKLLGIVHDIGLHMKGMNRLENNQSTSGLPPLTGDVHRGDASLEFIKHVCAVLALDQSVQHEVLVLRKNLLKYVDVKEFAPEAKFHGPCHSFILSNVICSYCNDCRDLDLCRDSALLTEEWRCAVPQCAQPYDREVMENALLQTVRQRERLYHLQDLVCTRCHQVKAAHLAEQCACAGSFRCKEDASEFREKMQIFLNIASRQKFQLLQECTSWILELR